MKIIGILADFINDEQKTLIKETAARGGYTVDISWREGRLEQARILCDRDGALRLADGRVFPHAAGDVIAISG